MSELSDSTESVGLFRLETGYVAKDFKIGILHKTTQQQKQFNTSAVTKKSERRKTEKNGTYLI